MSGEIPSFAKYVFLLGFIVSLIFGAWYFISPESWADFTGWTPEYSTTRIMGSVLLMLAIAALFAYRAETWKEVELYVLMIIVWTILGIVGMLWNFATLTIPVFGWINTGLLAMFFVLYLYIYMQARS
jgi:hypothetical protein